MPPLEPSEWKELLRRVAAGASIVETARAFGVHPSTVGKRLAAARADAKPRKAATRAASSAGVKSGAKPPLRDRGEPKSEPPAESKRARTARNSALLARRQLISRLYRAIDTKLKLMERRMHSEITALAEGKPEEGGNLTSADHERETRAFGALVKTINSVRQMQAELDDLANANPNSSAADARLAADADRYRRDVAERLAKFVPPPA